MKSNSSASLGQRGSGCADQRHDEGFKRVLSGKLYNVYADLLEVNPEFYSVILGN
jgi:hypothetical protein